MQDENAIAEMRKPFCYLRSESHYRAETLEALANRDMALWDRVA